MFMQRVFKISGSLAPFVIIAGLLYAGLFIKPNSVGEALPRPAFERGDRLYGLAVQPNGNMWLVGSNGKVLTSRDSTTWQYAKSPVKVALQDVAAWNDQHAVAVGDEGVVIVTHDAGKSWIAVDTPKSGISNKLIRVKVYPKGVAWAVGEGGVLLKTSDHGDHWSLARSEEDVVWNDVALAGDKVVVVGERGRILSSHDNGSTWREVSSPVKSSLMSVAFRSEKEGVAVGLDGVVLATHDGGAGWQKAEFTSPDHIGGVKASDQVDGKSLQQNRPEYLLSVEKNRSEHLLSVSWLNDRWLATGTKGVVALGSEDGSRWSGVRLAPEDRNWYTAISQRGEQVFLTGSRFVASSMKNLDSLAKVQ